MRLVQALSVRGVAARPSAPLRCLPFSRACLALLTLCLCWAPLVSAEVRTAGSCESLPGGVIEVEGSGGSGAQPTGYATLGAAFTAINNGVHTGAIVIDVCGDTNEGAATATLNASGAGSASYTTIAISPAGGAARTISGAITAGSPLIDFNGADNVTVDGLNAGGNTLTIVNTTASATSGTSTIRFIGGAANNTITRSNLQGSHAASVATNGATVFFSTDTVTTNGNDNNTISFNNIGPAGANLPTKGVLCNGSTTTTALGNSGNIIDNNNIFDYFGAAVTSAGVAANGGCNGNSITNNRFYQTATRTWTTGALHNGILLNSTTATSGMQGWTVTGNTIGYAAANQTGTYTLTGSTGRFAGIQFNGISGGTVSNINNNTVASVSLTGVTSSGTTSSSPFTGILILNGLVISNGNTIGSQTTTNSLVFSTTTASSTEINGLFNFSVDDWTANNNTVGGISVTNASTGATIVSGLRANTSNAKSINLSGNTVGGTVANSIQHSSGSASAQTIGLAAVANGSANWSGNTVRNISNSGGTGTAIIASVIGLLVTATTPNHTLSQNTVFGLSNSNTTAATVVTGIQFTGATANVVERNLIYGLTSATTSSTAEINGIRVAGGTTVYRNNIIAIGAGVANAIGAAATNSSVAGINGINEALGTNSFFHNSVYIGGSATAGTGASYAFNGTQTVNTRSFRDNIFFNARSNAGASGKHYAVKINGTTANPTGLTLNNNLYFANGSGGVFGFFNSADVANIAAWRTAVGQDLGSFEANPQFNDPTNATPDLHLHPTNATPAEGNGVDVGVVNDYDGQTRATLTPVDIGADAGNFNGADLSPPVISYTALANTSLTTSRTLSAAMTDVSGVATGGLAPRIYYRKNAGAYFSQPCSLASGTVNSGNWDCPIDHADVGGVVATDAINYFVIAQDALGNVGSNPGGAIASNVNTVTTPPGAPNTYTIVAAFSGVIPVGSGQTYTSLTNAGGIFEALNAGALTGNLTLSITSDLTAETGTHALNQWPEDGAGGYTLLIRPSAGPRTVSGSNVGALLRLNGADRVTIDGSTTGGTASGVGGSAALREMTLQNTSTGTSAVVLAVQSGAAGAQNNTIRNLNVLGQDPTTTLAGIALGGASPGTAGTDNDNNRVENCTVRRAIYGVYSAGQSAANPNAGTVIIRNDLSASGADRIRRIGIVVFAESGVQVVENQVGNIDTNESADAVAIGIGAQGIDAALTTTGNVTAALVARNRIHTVLSQSTTGFSAVGIAVAGGSGSANVIVNNMISGVSAPATSPDLVAGVFVAGVTGSSTRLLHNSVYLSGDRGTVATQTPGFGIAISGADPTVEVKDNAIANTQIASGGGTNAKAYAIGMASTTFANLNANYNDYFASGAQAGHFRTGSLGLGVGTDYATVALWGAAVSDDVNSLQVDPPFVSTSDLHLQAGSSLIGAGTPVGVTDDIDGQTRSATAPAIGADEIPPTVADLAITKTDGVASATPGTSTTYTIQVDNLAGPGPTTATVNDTFPAVLSCSWSCAVFGGASCGAGGPGNINDAVNLPVGGVVVYTAVCAISPAAPAGNLINIATVTNTGGTVDPNLANNSSTDNDVLTPSANLGITKTNGVTTSTPGLTTTYTIVASNAGPSNSPFVTVTDTFPPTLTGCSWTCTGSGATCGAGAMGNINDTFAMPAGSSATYTATCTIAPATTGTLSNTANIGGSVSDPNTANNSATDSDPLVQMAELPISKTDGVTTAIPGGSVTYSISVGNAGPSGNVTASVTDNFPATLTCTWTCSATPGSSCPASGSGNIGASVNLQLGGSVNFTANCNISPAATGMLVNTASVVSSADLTPLNNSATDADTLTPQADLQITKTNGVNALTAGGSTTYTIVASNNGPSNTTATVADTFPAALSCTWTCVGAGGGTCTASGSGNINNSVNLPAGGSVTHTASCTISAAATGTISNTATVTGTATDPVPGNNSATDSDPVTACGSNVVINGNDAGAGSLRQIIADACAGSTITFTPGLGIVTLTSAELLINKNLTIDGGTSVTVQRSSAGGTPNFRIFNVSAGTTATLRSLTVRNGNHPSQAGGIQNSGDLTLDRVMVDSNVAPQAGGVQNDGVMTIVDSAIVLNRAVSGGGGGLAIFGTRTTLINTTIANNQGIPGTGGILAAGLVTLDHCTIIGNSTTTGGSSGLATNTANVVMRNTIVSGNTGGFPAGAQIEGSVDASSHNNLVGSVGSGGLVNGVNGNLVGVSALTAVLSNYGGPTPTMALLPGSPAIDAGAASEMQQLTVSGPPGGFTLTFQGQTTSGLASSATAAQVQAALEALSTIGAGNVVVSAVGNVYRMRFAGALGSANQPAITGVGLGGAIVALATVFDGGTPATDQRGIARPQQTAVDIGAYESRGFTLAITGGNNQSAGIGTAFASPLVVSVAPIAAGEPVNGGQVSYTAPGAGASASLSPNPATIVAGSASTTATANGTVGGPYTVSAAARGANTVNFSLTNISLPTTTTITSDTPDPSVTGQPYAVNVQVSSATQSPLGTVTVSDGTGATCGPVALTAGAAPNSTASCNLTSTTAGAKNLTATYTPASGLFQASSGGAGHQVNPAATTISVSGPARSRINQPTAFSFTLAVTSPGAGTPTGVVTLSSGAASCTATLPATSCNLSFNTLGPRTVSASYAGDGNFAASASSGAGNSQTLVYALSDIALTKSDGVGHYEPGDLIVYSVLVRNLGPDDAANIRVTDIVPTGLASVVWSCDANGGAVCPVGGGSGNLDEVIATLPNASLVGFTFYGIVNGSPAQIANTATIGLPADTTIDDPQLANNSATDTDLLEFLFRNGFEEPLVSGPAGSFVLPGTALRLVLDEVARPVFQLDDKLGVAARVYARVFDGELQYALARRDASGTLQLAAWRSYSADPTLRWSASPLAGGWRVEAVDLR